MTYDEFLDATPFEITIKVEAYIQRLKEENQKPIIDAWLIGNMVRCAIGSLFDEKSKYPDLQDLLEPKKSEPMTPEQMEAQVLSLARAFGATEIIIDEG